MNVDNYRNALNLALEFLDNLTVEDALGEIALTEIVLNARRKTLRRKRDLGRH